MTLNIRQFTFNLYQENTYVISAPDGTAAVIDPGCYTAQEQQQLSAYIAQAGLQVRYLLNTHGHIDHMLGNRYVAGRYGVPLLCHALAQQELEEALAWGRMMGMEAEPSPAPGRLLEAGDTLDLGGIVLEVLYTPGHSAGSISLLHRAGAVLFSGDVLFQGSIGRTDLPGGSYRVLMRTLIDQLMPLDDSVRVYSGHGPATTIGTERRSNPYVLDFLRQS
ncbi:MAG: MBL fold metallo-hydrolase [Bacteroidia bacterium]|nr:MBL fold metallo-hydrolase [Bacteroidia bacterium]